jgi:uncharacterized protein (DUF2267 family)
MTYEEFLSVVAQWADSDRDQAARITGAVLETLARRLTVGEAKEIARYLPEELVPALFTEGHHPEGFGIDEFLRRIADRLGTDIPTAERYATAVFAALRTALSPDELADLIATLPHDFRFVLFPLDVSWPADRRLTEAVLETLAERLPQGEVDDLIAVLPAELHPPLERGKEHTGAKPMTRDEFLRQVAERAGIDVEHAVEGTRAVFAALQKVAGDEYFDVIVQLPPEYGPLLAHPMRR